MGRKEKEERRGEGENKIMLITQMSVCAKKRVRVISEGQLWILRSADMRRMQLLSSLYTFIFRLFPLFSNFKAFLITSLQFHFFLLK